MYERIIKVIEENRPAEALEQVKKIPDDKWEKYNFLGLILLYQQNFSASKEAFEKALEKEPVNDDLLFNYAQTLLALGYEREAKKSLESIENKDWNIYDTLGDIQFKNKFFDTSLDYYKNAFQTNPSAVIKAKIEKTEKTILETIEKVKAQPAPLLIKETKEPPQQKRKKVAFFVKKGMDSFLGDIIEALSKVHEVKKVVIEKNEDLKLVDQNMLWADVSWFEWCDELVIYGSRLPIAKDKTVFCRLHSYEAFSNYPSQVHWQSVDKVIFVAKHIQDFVIENYHLPPKKAVVIPNGIGLDKWTFKERKPGFNIAYVGYINYKKGPMLLLHAFKAIYDHDQRYKLYVAGTFQDPRYSLYFKQMIKEMGLEKNIFLEGWQNDLDTWLEDKNYVICTSVLEGNPVGIMQAMAKGIKPLIHNFVGANGQYPADLIWTSIDELKILLRNNSYNSSIYNNIIINKYSIDIQYSNFFDLLSEEPFKSNLHDNRYSIEKDLSERLSLLNSFI
jgi:hypothetical protein